MVYGYHLSVLVYTLDLDICTVSPCFGEDGRGVTIRIRSCTFPKEAGRIAPDKLAGSENHFRLMCPKKTLFRLMILPNTWKNRPLLHQQRSSKSRRSEAQSFENRVPGAKREACRRLSLTKDGSTWRWCCGSECCCLRPAPWIRLRRTRPFWVCYA